MKKILILIPALLLPACSTLNNYGLGGPPRQACMDAKAYIDDKLIGSDGVRLSLMRRFKDGDGSCPS